MKFGIGALLTALLLLSMALVPAVSAQGANQQKILLKPSQYNINLTEVQLIVWSDNHTSLAIQGEKKVGSSPQYFSIEVFPENMTYKTTKKQINEVTQITYGQVKNTTELKSKNIYDNIVTAASTNRYAQVEVLTEDPIFLDLAKTRQTLGWSTDGSTVTINSRSILGEAYTTPWPFNTHWYIDITPAFYGSYTYSTNRDSVTTDGYGQYYNDDFGNVSQRTWAWHRIKIQGNAGNPIFYYWAWWNHWGEGASLLQASAFIE